MVVLLVLAVAILFVLVLDQRQKLARVEKALHQLASERTQESNEARHREKLAVAEESASAATAPITAVPNITAPLPVSDADTPSPASELRSAYRALVDEEKARAVSPDVGAPNVAPPIPADPISAAPSDPAKPAPVKAVAASAAPPASTRQSEAESTAEATAKKGFSFSFEDLFGRKLPIWAGGITLAVAGVLIVKYAIDAGLLTPWARIIAGLLFGGALIAGAEFAYRKEALVADPRVRQALAGAGIATLYASILMAHNGFGLIGPFAAFVLMALITAAALGLSLRFGAPSALLGLAGGLATPALVGSMQPNIPLLSAYLALTIGALTAVSRHQRWMWLGIAALAGGGVWSLILIATMQLSTVNAMSLGALVLGLSIAIPLLSFADTRHALFRAAVAAIGALQIAVLVARGGFSPLHWSLFILIAFACQWLLWRERKADQASKSKFALLQLASLILSLLLLLLWWPFAPGMQLLGVGGALLAIHAGPLFPRVWEKHGDQPIAQWAVMGLAIVVVALRHTLPDVPRPTLALVSLGAALFTLIPVVTSWAKIRALADQGKDIRFAVLAGVAAILLVAAVYFAFPLWFLAIGTALVALAALELARMAGDRNASTPAFACAGLAFLFLFFTPSYAVEGEFMRLAGQPVILSGVSVLRWAVLAGMGLLFTLRAPIKWQGKAASAAAAMATYGAVAQFAPAQVLPFVAPLILLGLAAFVTRRGPDGAVPMAVPAFGMSAFIALLWAAEPLLHWVGGAQSAVIGLPLVATNLPDIGLTVRQLAMPAALIAGALWLLRPALPQKFGKIAGVAMAAILVVAVHILYRHAFAQVAGADFVSTGMMQRAVWAGLLLGCAWGVARYMHQYQPFARTLAYGLAVAASVYLFYFSGLLHNPLWSAQSVGAWPLVNALTPTYALLFAGVWMVERYGAAVIAESKHGPLTRVADIARMILIILFAYSVLGQAFHGSRFDIAALGEGENILRSILAIALAIGFLLWGIRQHRRDWRIASLVLMLGAVGKVFIFDASGLTGLTRIASFVALGFSLIGIGWLYSRQLRSTPQEAQKD